MGGGAGLAAARGVAEGEEPAAVAAGRDASSARVEGDAEGGALAASGQRRVARGACGGGEGGERGRRRRGGGREVREEGLGGRVDGMRGRAFHCCATRSRRAPVQRWRVGACGLACGEERGEEEFWLSAGSHGRRRGRAAWQGWWSRGWRGVGASRACVCIARWRASSGVGRRHLRRAGGGVGGGWGVARVVCGSVWVPA